MGSRKTGQHRPRGHHCRGARALFAHLSPVPRLQCLFANENCLAKRPGDGPHIYSARLAQTWPLGVFLALCHADHASSECASAVPLLGARGAMPKRYSRRLPEGGLFVVFSFCAAAVYSACSGSMETKIYAYYHWGYSICSHVYFQL